MSNKIIASLDALAAATPMDWVHAAAALCNLADDIRALATAPDSSATSTVGELLEPEHIVEFNFEGDWHQAKRVERLRHWQVRAWILGCDGTMGWSSWHDSDQRVRDAWHLPAKVVPANQAGLDPVIRNAATKE